MNSEKIDYQELWRFVGNELSIKRDANLKIEFLSSQEMRLLAQKNTELNLELNARENGISKEEFTEYLKEHLPNHYLAVTSPTELNGICFVVDYMKKLGAKEREILQVLPNQNSLNYDVFIYLNEGNIELRRQEFSKKANYNFTSDDIRIFLIIHEINHAYERLSGSSSVDPEQGKFDFKASEIFWKWKKSS